MNVNMIINNIADFFDNANKEDIDAVKEAFSIDITGDISVNDYLANFYNEYFYSGTDESIMHSSSKLLPLEPNGSNYQAV